VVTFIATSEAYHFAMEAIFGWSGDSGSVSIIEAARYTMVRAVSTERAISASIHCIPWNEARGLPNCTRSLAYLIEASSAPWAIPRA